MNDSRWEYENDDGGISFVCSSDSSIVGSARRNSMAALRSDLKIEDDEYHRIRSSHFVCFKANRACCSVKPTSINLAISFGLISISFAVAIDRERIPMKIKNN